MTNLERLCSVEGSLEMLCAVLKSTDILRADSSDIVDMLEGCYEDIQAVIINIEKDE